MHSGASASGGSASGGGSGSGTSGGGTSGNTPNFNAYCSGCHDSASGFGSATVTQIQNAINTVRAMSGLKSLSAATIQTISTELAGAGSTSGGGTSGSESEDGTYDDESDDSRHGDNSTNGGRRTHESRRRSD